MMNEVDAGASPALLTRSNPFRTASCVGPVYITRSPHHIQHLWLSQCSALFAAEYWYSVRDSAQNSGNGLLGAARELLL